jgi:hypothetical protein
VDGSYPYKDDAAHNINVLHKCKPSWKYNGMDNHMYLATLYGERKMMDRYVAIKDRKNLISARNKRKQNRMRIGKLRLLKGINKSKTGE